MQGGAAGVDEQPATGLDQPAAVVQLAAAQVEPGLCIEGAAVVVDALPTAVEQQLAATDHALAVVQAKRAELNIASRFEAPALVLQLTVADFHEQPGLDRAEGAAAVVELAGNHLHGLGRGEGAGDVAEAVGVQVEGIAGAERAAVVEHFAGSDGHGAASSQGAATVVQALRVAHLQSAAVGGDHGAAAGVQVTAVEQHLPALGLAVGKLGLLRADLQGAITGQGAAVTVDFAGADVEFAATSVLDLAFAVGQGACVEAELAGVAGDAAVAVVELAGDFDEACCGAGLDQFTAVVRELVGVDLQVADIDLGAVAAHGCAGFGVEAASAVDGARAEVKVAVVGGQVEVAGVAAAVAEVDRVALQIKGAAGVVLAVGGNLLSLDRERGLAAGGTLGVNAGCQQRVAAAVEFGRVDVQIALSGQLAGVGDRALAAGVQVAFGVQAAAVVHCRGTGHAGRPSTADGALVEQLAVGADHHVTGHGADLPGVAYANPGLGTDQLDLAGVHAAQLGDVDGHLGLGAVVLGQGGGLGIVGVDLITPGGDLEVVGPDPGVDLDAARDQVGVVAVAGIQALAGNAQGATFDAVAGDAPVLHLRAAGGQGRAVGIDEAAAVTGDPGRVGDDHFGALAGDFDIATQLARVARIDFVEDDLGTAPAKVRVALDPAAQLGFAVADRVVEDRATAVDVELAVVVARHPAGARRADVDLRRAVGAVDHHRLLPAGRATVGDDASGPGRGHAEAD
ncbi:hypothetical protein PS631_02825 [Pseudomonas fluorescens]|uniref:Uncharacterized protein n=1 Tax=Pseudomonas fluorescens TaxID=294 RepID=A0A5E6TS35_PSEFL|nr:hypothetical protein PS631_02825 [Pseudomonas fluorescens]